MIKSHAVVALCITVGVDERNLRIMALPLGVASFATSELATLSTVS